MDIGIAAPRKRVNNIRPIEVKTLAVGLQYQRIWPDSVVRDSLKNVFGDSVTEREVQAFRLGALAALRAAARDTSVSIEVDLPEFHEAEVSILEFARSGIPGMEANSPDKSGN